MKQRYQVKVHPKGHTSQDHDYTTTQLHLIDASQGDGVVCEVSVTYLTVGKAVREVELRLRPSFNPEDDIPVGPLLKYILRNPLFPSLSTDDRTSFTIRASGQQLLIDNIRQGRIKVSGARVIKLKNLYLRSLTVVGDGFKRAGQGMVDILAEDVCTRELRLQYVDAKIEHLGGRVKWGHILPTCSKWSYAPETRGES